MATLPGGRAGLAAPPHRPAPAPPNIFSSCIRARCVHAGRTERLADSVLIRASTLTLGGRAGTAREGRWSGDVVRTSPVASGCAYSGGACSGGALRGERSLLSRADKH